ncbi:Fic domain protein, PA0574 type [hydrothermal vent metagenome]|uniref:Fic domain protein, PA0574 type n=1 Tax=hydrothermal vent metagenome TaxID=652676 RepID=A0A3B0ZYC5_9ZZZZ
MALILSKWVWQQPDWPDFRWQDKRILPLLRAVRLKQGVLLGKTGSGFEYSTTSSRAALDILLQNIITSSAIEGEQLNAPAVRSSLAKRLGLDQSRPYPISKRSEGLAEMMLDATQNLSSSLTLSRLFWWHSWLFPEDDLLLQPIKVAQLRGDEPMQVVSGRIDRPKVHFEAPPRNLLESGLSDFIDWFNQSRGDATLDPLLRAAISHFWLITLHPFDDGNGRITRALTDLALAQADSPSIHLYAMSASILARRSAYYSILEQSQRGGVDITDWLEWFLHTLDAALQTSLNGIEYTLEKSRFWQRHHDAGLSAPQIKVLNRLLEGGDNNFEQGISAAQYQKVAKVSKATATRHLVDLLAKGCIQKLSGGGRSTRYSVVGFKP